MSTTKEMAHFRALEEAYRERSRENYESYWNTSHEVELSRQLSAAYRALSDEEQFGLGCWWQHLAQEQAYKQAHGR